MRMPQVNNANRCDFKLLNARSNWQLSAIIGDRFNLLDCQTAKIVASSPGRRIHAANVRWSNNESPRSSRQKLLNLVRD